MYFAPFLIFSALTRIYQSSKYTEKTAESEAIVVEFVKGNSFEVKQTTRDDIVLSFNQAVELTTADVTIKETVDVIGGTDTVEYLIKSVTPSEDKKTYTVAVFYEFNDGGAYEVAVKGVEETVKFVASKGAPKTIVLHSNPYNTADCSVTVEQDTKILATLFDAKGVNVTTNELLDKLTFTVKYADSNYERMDTSLYFTQVGETAVVTAEYRTYEYDENGNEKDVVKSEPYTFYAVAKGAELITGITGYTTTGNFWGSDRTVVKMNDNRFLQVSYRTKDFPYDDMYITAMDQPLWNKNETVFFGNANFTALDPDILEVYDAAGKVGLFPRKTGTARVMVSYVTDVNGTAVTTAIGAVTIDVKDSPVLNTIALKQTSVTLSTNPANFNEGVHSQDVENMEIALEAKDQYTVAYTSIEPATVGVNGLKGNNTLSQRAVDNGAVSVVATGGAIKLVVDNDLFATIMNDMNGDGNADTVATNATRFSFTLAVKDSTPGVNIVKTTGFEVFAKRPVDVNNKTPEFDINKNDIEFVVDFGIIQWNGNNIARFWSNDYNDASESPKVIDMALYQLNNGARYNELPILGVLPAKDDVAAAADGYYYVINWNGENISDDNNFGWHLWDRANGNGNKTQFKLCTTFNNASNVDASKNIVMYTSNLHGAGKYEVILYRVENGKESRVTSRSINVTNNPGQYTFVSRDEAIITLAAGESLTDNQSKLLACFTIADKEGLKVSHNSWELKNDVAKFGNYERPYKVNLKDVEGMAADSVYVESITVWEEVTMPSWGESTIYVEYTVPVGYMVKVVNQ